MIEVLIQRVKESDNNFRSIIAEELINIIPKVTEHHLKLLCFLYILSNKANFQIKSKEELIIFINEYIYKYFYYISKSIDIDFLHLESLKCGTIEFTETTLESILSERFSEGFTNTDEYKNFIITSLPNTKDCFNFWEKSLVRSFTISHLGIYLAIIYLKKENLIDLKYDKIEIIFSKHIMPDTKIVDIEKYSLD